MFDRVINWMGRSLARTWTTQLIMLLLFSLLIYSLQEAKWVRDETALASCFLWGVLFGWLLARSLFRGWQALLYALFISVIIAVESVGHILPRWNELLFSPFSQTVDQMNLRSLELYLRISGWLQTLNTGENVRDSGLFVLLLGFILMISAIWLMWAVLRWRQALVGLLPLGILYAINIHLSRQSLGNYMAFLFLVILLMVRTSFNKQQEDWQHRQVDYPDQLGLEWGAAAVGLAVVIVLVARAAPFFGTAEGWRAISDWMDRWHQETSTTATRLFSGVNPPPPPDQKREVSVNTPNLNEIGAPIAQGDETIMWVSISDPAPIPPGVGMNVPVSTVPTHYWRSDIYGFYTGRGWDPIPLGEVVSQQSELPKSPPAGRYFLRQTFQLEARHTEALFSVNDPVQTGEKVSLRALQGDSSKLLEGKVSQYQVISAATRVSSNQLAKAPTGYAPEIRSVYLQLPDSLPDRVRVLANRIVAGAADPYHKALDIQNYLRENEKYDLNLPEAPKNRDVVDYFLFDSKAGFCSHYASAMVVMLRSIGVPARVATGYAMGGYDPERQAYRVPASASHAWVEVYFPGYGWVEFEPTTSRTPIVYSEETSTGSTEISPAVRLEEPKSPASPFLIGLVVIAALLLLVLPFLLLRMFSASKKAPKI